MQCSEQRNLDPSSCASVICGDVDQCKRATVVHPKAQDVCKREGAEYQPDGEGERPQRFNVCYVAPVPDELDRNVNERAEPDDT